MSLTSHDAGPARHARRILPLLAAALMLTGFAAFGPAPAASAATRPGIVAVAQAEVGVSEPSGCDKYNIDCSSTAWCAAFAEWVWNKAGVSPVPTTLVARGVGQWGVDHGLFKYRSNGGGSPQPGDIVVYGTPANVSGGHMGIVESVNSDSTITTIEGNYSNKVTRRSHIDPATATNTSSGLNISGYVTPPNAGSGTVSGTASVYGILADGRLTYSAIDAATGDRIKTVVSTTPLGFTPKAMATLDFNTLLVTSTSGQLYRVDIVTNNTSLGFETPVALGSGWTHDLLAYDGSTYLYGIAGGVLHRYTLTATKPTAAAITANTVIGSGFTLNTLTSTAPGWIASTTSDGELLSYRIRGADDWTHTSCAPPPGAR
ncbi:CHAP domain-containing protein [Kitasatospora griseola]|uniref:CHAP domain-containing protein n=1 Tax=Kitasatospora griseola TaxID=2064 RepID=UPI003855AF3D